MHTRTMLEAAHAEGRAAALAQLESEAAAAYERGRADGASILDAGIKAGRVELSKTLVGRAELSVSEAEALISVTATPAPRASTAPAADSFQAAVSRHVRQRLGQGK